MRLLLRYRTGDNKNHHGEVSAEQVRNVLSGLGWLPSDERFARQKLVEIIDRMPETIRTQVQGGHPILITTRPGTWGVVSTENKNRIHIRLLHDDLSTLRGEADEVVSQFPGAFNAEFDRDLGFEDDVVIRRFDTEERIVAGVVQQLRDYSFLKYIRELRKREGLVISVFAVLTLLLTIGSVLVYILTAKGVWDYERGYLDRTGTTFLTAALTILVNLLFDFRSWRNERVQIKWDFASRPSRA